MKACPTCGGKGTVEGHWRLTWGDHSFTGDDLIASDFALVATMVDKGWMSADAELGPHVAVYLIAVYVARVERREFLQVLGEVGREPAEKVLRSISFVPVVVAEDESPSDAG